MGRLAAAIVMGLVTGLLVLLCMALVTRTPAPPLVGFGLAALAAAWAALAAPHGRAAWRRTFVLAGLVCLALPLMAFVGSILATSPVIAGAATSAERTGATIGAGFGAMIATGTAGMFGFFGAAIFLVAALFLREPRIVIVQAAPTSERGEPSIRL
jgi:hypothetical protein